MDKIKFPNTVLESPKSGREKSTDEEFEEFIEKLPDLKKEIKDPAILDRVNKIARLSTAERKMGKFRDSLAMLIWEIVPELKRSDIDLYFIYRDRVFLICWKCLCVWSHIVESEERLPENFAVCPNGCGAVKV